MTANVTGGDLEKLPCPSFAPILSHLCLEVLIARWKLRLTLPKAETLLLREQCLPLYSTVQQCTTSLLSTRGGFTPRMKSYRQVFPGRKYPQLQDSMSEPPPCFSNRLLVILGLGGSCLWRTPVSVPLPLTTMWHFPNLAR